MLRVSVSDKTQPCLPSLCFGTFQTDFSQGGGVGRRARSRSYAG